MNKTSAYVQVASSWIPKTVQDSRGMSYESEAKDCTVRALATCANITYDHAHRLMAEAGRKDGTGTHWNRVMAANPAWGFVNRHDILSAGNCRMINVLKRLPCCRRFVVKIHKHVFAVIDGKVVDAIPVKPFSRCMEIWEFRPESAVLTEGKNILNTK